MKAKRIVWLLLFVFGQSASTTTLETWFLEKDEKGIQIYSINKKHSKYKSFKAIVVVETSINKVIEVLKDVDKYKNWFAYTKKSKLLKLDNGAQYIYVETSFPWPYKNRDMIYKMVFIRLDKGKLIVTMEGIADYIPMEEGTIRMKNSSGHILLEEISPNMKLTYVFHSDPQGNIPVWLANNSIAEMPFKTLMNLKVLLSKASILKNEG